MGDGHESTVGGLPACRPKPVNFMTALGASAVWFSGVVFQPHHQYEVNGISRVVYDISGKPPATCIGGISRVLPVFS